MLLVIGPGVFVLKQVGDHDVAENYRFLYQLPIFLSITDFFVRVD